MTVIDPGIRTPTLWFEDVVAGDELPELVKHPDTRQLVMYAGAAQDFVPIHYDLNVAQAAGHPTVGLSNWTSRIGQSTFPVGARPVSGRSLKRESKKGSDSSNLKSECATLKAL